MMSSLAIGLVSIPVLIAEWIGVIALRRGMRGAGWWLMLAGVVIHTLSVLGQYSVFALLDLRLLRDRTLGDEWMFLLMFLPVGGSLLFAIGFALHGLKASRASQRQVELEQLVSAMSEEMDRLKGSPRA